MKDTLKIGTLTVLIAFAGTAVLAEGPRGDKGRGEMPSFSSFDANGDGQVTLEELSAAGDARFAELDSNSDGQVSLEEFQAHAESQARSRAEEMFAKLDADGDGFLGRDALEARKRGPSPERIISRLDTDGDGMISEAEFDAAKERRQARDGGKGKRKSN